MEAVSSSSQFTYYKNGVSKQIDTSNVRPFDEVMRFATELILRVTISR